MAATFSYAQAAKGIVATPSSKTTPESNQDAKPEELNAESTPEAGDAVTSETPKEAETTPVAKENESEPTASTNGTETSNASAGNSSTTAATKADESSNTPNGTSDPTGEKQPKASASEKQDNGSEKPKDKSEKEKSEPPKELKAAPLPSVNIWQQRREAQDAKVKANASLKPTTAAAKTTSKTPSAASSISGDNQQEPAKTSNKKSDNRRKADGAKGREDVALPPVADANLWPTPQVAQGEEKKKPQDKSEKSEKSPATRGKEKWMPVPYVPTAVFNTPLPTAARRGGRAARGGRDTGRNGSHGSEKSAAGQGAQGAVKQTTPAERGRNETNTARANSLPAPARRSNSADGATDARKNQLADRTRGPKGADNGAAPAGRQADGFARHQKTFARNHDGAQKGGDQSGRNAHIAADAHAGARTGSTHDRRFENSPKSAEFGGFHADRKEKDFSRESRADRGRGSHRGRGGHSGYNGAQNSHFANNHSHNGFVHPKSFGFNERQRSQPHGLGNGSRGHGMSMRSPSLPNSAAMYNVYPFPPEINTMYGFQPMAAGPMSAVPYQQYMEPYSLISVLTMQLEYYFSVDNLCKDLFLRKHMDTQGFVSLGFIAGFKRVKNLTEDFELLRHVSRSLRSVEHIQGEDGVDRLRPRERWEQWVLPLEQRDPSAQHNGPSAAKTDENSALYHQVDGAANGLPNGTGETLASKTPLSSEAPEFSPAKAVSSPSETANV